MSVATKPNKENFRLLDFSSDGESEDLQLEIIPSRKKKITRRERSRSSAPQVPNPNLATEVRCAVLWAVRGTLFLWLLMLTWICASLYEQVSAMKADVTRVSTSSDSVGDSLQLCHTAAKELRGNATELRTRLTTLEVDFQKLVKRVEKVNQELGAVSKQLVSAPELVQTPQKLQTLQLTMADIGSQITGFAQELKSSKKQVSDATTGLEEIKSLLQRLEAKSNETLANISSDANKQEELSHQILMLNATLEGKVEALEKRINELTRPMTTLAPSTLSTTVKGINNTTITSVSNATSTTPPTQGQPSKPNVVHTEGIN